VILMLEHARYAGLKVVDELHTMAAVAMLLEVFGPIIIQRALIWAREAPESHHAP
jgi:hypothetical protein